MSHYTTPEESNDNRNITIKKNSPTLSDEGVLKIVNQKSTIVNPDYFLLSSLILFKALPARNHAI